MSAQLDIQTRYVAVSESQLIKTKQDIPIAYLKLDTKCSPWQAWSVYSILMDSFQPHIYGIIN